jgi:hypothetical protein
VTRIEEALAGLAEELSRARPGVALVLSGHVPGDAERFDHTIVADNEIRGALSLYGFPAQPELIIRLRSEELVRELHAQLQEVPYAGFLGTLHLRGNQILDITVSDQTVAALTDFRRDGKPQVLRNQFGRCLLNENVIHQITMLAAEHAGLASNEAVLHRPVAPPQGATAWGFIVASTSVYVANHARSPGADVIDVSGKTERAANLLVQFV